MNPKGTSPLGGIICLWSGAIVDIPDGWFLCDGQHGTPDLTNRFIVGAGDTYDPADTGGSATHGHGLTMDSHSHYLVAGNQILKSDPDGDYSPVDKSRTIDGVADVEPHMPLYYSLAYIMKG